MDQSIKDVLSSRFSQEEFVSFLNDNPSKVSETFELALEQCKPQSWRAAWVLNHCLSQTDDRITPYVDRLIDHLKTVPDGHQREIFKLLERALISEDLEGKLFDVTASIWEDVSKTPSVRIVAFRILLKIASNYPELNNEIDFLTQNQYIESLSPGIKNSMNKALKRYRKKSNL